MKYYFPIHLDGGNRGCEAIAKGSAILMNETVDHLIGYCRNVDLDKQLGLDSYLTLIPYHIESYFIDRCVAAINKLFHTNKTLEWRWLYFYRSFLRMITKDDVMISTGGDMLCYGNNQVIYTNNWLHKRGVKTVLWGCSMGEENQTQEKLQTLFNFSLIYVRDSLTYDYFKRLGLKNLCLLPDPAFILPAESCSIPNCFSHDEVIGLNISNFVMGGMTLDSRFGQEVLGLVDYILRETKYHILLIPHVTWNIGNVNQDDRQMARIIHLHFGESERIHILDMDNLNYCQIRYVISKCKMFIGARTHAVISAYSTCVPAIALGYSVKSRGIAKDLGLDERLVVNCKNCSEGSLLRSFLYLKENEEAIREHLEDTIPAYQQKTYQIREYIGKL
ncbi:MAG: polysaccharide pyruvyl transferase family protein [Bacteroidaceae bacterium]|nr:polysaccharide pyruvyl transferase family protein [Bacteroidaceae bacterium]